MKGLIYMSLLLNKGYLIAAGIAAAAGTAVGVLLELTMGKDPGLAGTVGIILIALTLVVMAILDEFLARELEKNIKVRFTDYALAAGISKNMFVMTELVKNLILAAAAFAIGSLMQLVFMAADSSFISVDNFKMTAIFALIVGLINWVCLPLVISLKSAEKAGLAVGLVIGFGLVMLSVAVKAALANEDDSLFQPLLEWCSEPWFIPAAIGVGAVIYALFYVILLTRVKRGDVC